MRIDAPTTAQIPALRALWKEAFADEDAFLDIFFSASFSPERCRCIILQDQLAAALYWMDCSAGGEKLAYIYAVATAKAYRGRGLCRALLEDTHAVLKRMGYAGAILVPGEPGLFAMYSHLGYRICSQIQEFTCVAADTATALQRISAEEYAAARPSMLPEGSVLQVRENRTFLDALYEFYRGEQVLFCCAAGQGSLFCPELLGDARLAGKILRALGKETGTFRTPGSGKSFAMYLNFTDAPMPAYLGFAFD